MASLVVWWPWTDVCALRASLWRSTSGLVDGAARRCLRRPPRPLVCAGVGCTASAARPGPGPHVAAMGLPLAGAARRLLDSEAVTNASLSCSCRCVFVVGVWFVWPTCLFFSGLESGNMQLEITNHVYKSRLDQQGHVIHGEKKRIERNPVRQAVPARKPVDLPPGYCGSCYGAAPDVRCGPSGRCAVSCYSGRCCVLEPVLGAHYFLASVSDVSLADVLSVCCLVFLALAMLVTDDMLQQVR